MDSSTLTVMLVIPAAALISSPLAYQCRCSALAYLPLRLALKVKALPMVAWPSALFLTDASPKMAVTSRFCLKFVSVRVLLVSPSLHLTKTWPSAGTAVTVMDLAGSFTE